MTTLVVTVAGIGAWTPGWPGWPALRDALLAGDDACSSERSAPLRPEDRLSRPVAQLLPAAERRRVPDGVAVALEVAREALAAAASTSIDPSTLASVFASAHGELAIVDYLCRTLADDPSLLSPTRFHHSVHNAAAGYWTIATPSTGPSTSIAAGDASFALGLFEAATQVVADGRPVLFVAFDTPGAGLLTRAAPNTALFAAALLLTPAGAADGPRLAIGFDRVAKTEVVRPPGTADLQSLAASSPAARGIALLAALAHGTDATVHFEVEPATVVGSPGISVGVLATGADEPTAPATTLA